MRLTIRKLELPGRTQVHVSTDYQLISIINTDKEDGFYLVVREDTDLNRDQCILFDIVEVGDYVSSSSEFLCILPANNDYYYVFYEVL